MKPLLTALIAAIFLVLPLHADEPTQTISVRVIDHEGEPVVGLGLSVTSGEHTDYGLTGEDGVMTTSVAVPVYGRSAIVRPQPEHGVFLGDFRGSTTLITETNRTDSYLPQLLVKHRDLLKTYAIDRATPVSSTDLVEGIFTLQLPESVRCSVNIRFSGFDSHGTAGWWLLPRNGRSLDLRSEVPQVLGVDEDLDEGRNPTAIRSVVRSSFSIPSGRRTPIGFCRLGECFLLDMDSERKEQGGVTIDFEVPGLQPGHAKVNFAVPAGTDRYGRFLVSSDGKYGRALDVNPSSVYQNESLEGITLSHALNQGEYVMVSVPARAGIGHLWSPNSVFDTMLRLRRGEDLPHLKRITIPEGGTVELSSEDFLDPPADTPPAEVDPR